MMGDTEQADAGPRQGPLKVLEVGDSPALSYCGKLLGALGADVVKVSDGVGSDGQPGPAAVSPRVRAAYLDGGKTVVEVDLAAPGTGSFIRELAATADVLITALPAGTHPELDDAALRADLPDLVIGRCPSLEPGGDLPVGGDYQALAASGLMALIGEPDRAPLRLPGTQADYTGALSLFTGVMFALYGRFHGGSGAVVRTSGLRAAAYLDWKSQIFFEEEGRILVRGSDAGPVVLRCADGFVGFYYRPEEWAAVRRFVGDAALEDERFATQKLRDTNRTELHAILERFTVARPKAEVYHTGQAAGIPVGAVWTMAELLADEQLRVREFLCSRPGAGIVAPGVPWTVDGERPAETDGGTAAGRDWVSAATATAAPMGVTS